METNATLFEAGNGFPEVGEFVYDSGEWYEVITIDSRISTHNPGVGNSIRAYIELVYEIPEFEHSCKVKLD
jgi:hypothetical protein